MNDKHEKIIFFTTFGCHLCEQVEEMLAYILQQKTDQIHFSILQFDIIDDEKILEKYRTSIPILKKENTNDEIFWPFSFEELCEWLSIEL